MRLLKAIIISVCMGVLLSLSVGIPAQAAVSDCQSNETCMFEHTSFEGAHYDYNSSTHGCQTPFSAAWNDRVSSVVNTTSHRIWFYENAGCTGRVIMVPPHTLWTTQATITAWPNNKFSSLYAFAS